MDEKAAEEGSIDVKKSGVLHNNSNDGNSVPNKTTHNTASLNRVATVNPAPVLPANNISMENKAPLAILDSASSLLSKDNQIPLSVVLNVGGQKFETLLKNFSSNFPNSRLWKLAHAIEAGAGTEEILQFCDRFKRGHLGSAEDGLEHDYQPAEYFFDTNPNGFASILDSYRSGHLHVTSSNCAVTTRDDLAYWGLDELTLEPCCAVKFYPEIEVCIKEINMEESEKQREIEREKLEDWGDSFVGRYRKILWNLFEYPSTSRAAQFNACFSLSMVVISTACFVLSCVFDKELVITAENQDSTLIEESSTPWAVSSANKTSTSTTEAPEREKTGSEQVIAAIVWVDAFTAVYFTIEYVVRLACSPRKIKFFIDPMNLVDLFAILPYFLSMVLEHLSEFHIIGKTGKVLRLVRVTRILRVFKLVRHFAGLQSLFSTLIAACKELGLLIMLVGVTVLTFSSLIYFAEKDDQDWSFMEAFWWGLLTITTVGYGTVTPMSGIGKLIGGICALMGVFTITLPVPIMVNNFHQFYKNKLWRGEVALQRRERQRLGVPDANPKKYSCVLATTGEKGSTKERQHLNQVELNGVQS